MTKLAFFSLSSQITLEDLLVRPWQPGHVQQRLVFGSQAIYLIHILRIIKGNFTIQVISIDKHWQPGHFFFLCYGIRNYVGSLAIKLQVSVLNCWQPGHFFLRQGLKVMLAVWPQYLQVAILNHWQPGHFFSVLWDKRVMLAVWPQNFYVTI